MAVGDRQAPPLDLALDCRDEMVHIVGRQFRRNRIDGARLSPRSGNSTIRSVKICM